MDPIAHSAPNASLVKETCTNPDCDTYQGTHVFPAVGTTVRVTTDYETREIGDDACTPVPLTAGERGQVVSYVVEWHDVDVALFSRDGLRVWVDPDLLEVLPR